MKKVIPAKWAFAWMLLCFSILRALADYQFKHYDANDGLSQNSVMAIVQDSMGFIWLGTHDGLNRYDGKSFTVYRKSSSPSGLGSNRIGVIHEAPDHRLWIGTEHGLYIYSPTTDSFSHFDVSTAEGKRVENEVNVLTGDDRRILIASSGDGVFVYDLQSGELTNHRLPGRPSVSTLYIDDGKTVWIGFYEGGLAYTRNLFKTVHTYTDRAGQVVLDRQSVTGIMTTEPGRLCLCSSVTGLSELNIAEKRLTQLIPSVSGKNIFAHGMIRNGDEVLMATESGLFAYDLTSRSYKQYGYEATNPFSLSDNSLQTLYLDRDGGLWVGSYFGGVCYAPRMSYAFTNYLPRVDVPGSLHGRRVGELVETADGNIWVATEDGGLNRLNPHTERFDYPLDGSILQNVQSLCIVGRELWVGTFDNGLKVLDVSTGQLLRSYLASNDETHLHDNVVFTIEQASDGHIYVGTIGGVYRHDRLSDSFEHLTDLPQHIVYNIMEDHERNLWVAVYNIGIFMRPADGVRPACRTH